MAKKIVYNVEINSEDAQGSIKRIEERLQELNQTADTSQREINSLTQELKELGQTNQNENINSVQSLRRAYRELVEELQRTEEGTERFQELAQAAGDVKNQIDAAQDSINNFNKSPFENLRNNFTSLKRRILDLDLDGFKNDFKDLGTNIRLAGTSFIGIQKGAGLAANGLRVFRAALISTGIGVVVVAIGTLISEFDTLKKSGGLIGGAFTLLGNIFKAFTSAVLKLSDGLGLTSNAYQTFLTKSDETVDSTKDLNEEVQKLKEELDGVDFDEKLTKQLEEYTKQVKELEKEQLKLLKLQTVGEIESKKEIQRVESKTKVLNFQTKALEDLIDVISGRTLEDLTGIPAVGGDLIEGTIGDAIRQTNDATQKAGLRQIETRLKQLLKNKENVLKVEQEIADKKAQIEELNNLRLRKIEKDRQAQNAGDRKKEFENSIKLLEEEQKRRLIILLKDFENEEDLKVETEKLDIEFLEKRKRINERFGISTADIEIALAQKVIDKKLELAKKEEEERKKRQIGFDEIDENAIKNVEKQIGLFEKAIGVQKQLTDDELQQAQLSIDLVDEKIRLLEEANLTELEIFQDALDEKLIAEKEYQDILKGLRDKATEEELDRIDKEKQERQQLNRELIQFAGGLTNEIGRLTDIRYDNELRRAGENQEAIEKIQKEQFETNKALSIVSAIINTAQGITNALATSGPPWVGIAMAAVVGAIGAAEVALIAAQEFNPGQSAPNSSFQPNLQGSQSLGNVSQFTPNVLFAQAGSGANVQTAGGGSPQSLQFTGSISVSEINNTQQLVNVYETNSILGGG